MTNNEEEYQRMINSIQEKERELFLTFTNFDKFKEWTKKEQAKIDSGFLENANYEQLLMNIGSAMFFNKKVMPLFLYEDYLCLLSLLLKEVPKKQVE